MESKAGGWLRWGCSSSLGVVGKDKGSVKFKSTYTLSTHAHSCTHDNSCSGCWEGVQRVSPLTRMAMNMTTVA